MQQTMINQKNFFRTIFLLMGLCFIFQAQANIVATVSPDKVELGQTVRLTLTMEGQQSNEVPDLTPLQKNFSIIGTEKSMSYTFLNGQSQSLKQWHIHLMPKKVGRITVPPIAFGQQKSTALQLEVIASGQSTGYKNYDSSDDNDEEDVFLETKLNPKNPYINQQVTLTVKLITRQRLMDVDYQAPAVSNALMLALAQAKQYQTIRNGQNYLVEEQQYAIFPQKSGVMTVEGPSLNALAYGMMPKQVRLRTTARKLQVKPIPQGLSQKNWLPAKKVQLYERYEDASDQLAVGDTMTRVVTLQATGVPAQLLPSPQFEENKQLQAYPEKPEAQNQVQQAKLIGKKTIKVTYIVNQAGKVKIPEVTVPWFDVTSGEQKIARLPQKTLTVAGQIQKNPESVPPRNNDADRPKTLKGQPDLQDKASPSNALQSLGISTSWAWLVAALFAFLWLVTLGLWWLRSKKHSRHGKKYWFKQLQQASAENHPEKAKEALIHWAKCQWPEKTFVNLHQVAQQFEAGSLREEILHLSKVLYQPGQQEPWQGKAFAHIIDKWSKKQKTSHRQKDDLPPINPS